MVLVSSEVWWAIEVVCGVSDWVDVSSAVVCDVVVNSLDVLVVSVCV